MPLSKQAKKVTLKKVRAELGRLKAQLKSLRASSAPFVRKRLDVKIRAVDKLHQQTGRMCMTTAAFIPTHTGMAPRKSRTK